MRGDSRKMAGAAWISSAAPAKTLGASVRGTAWLSKATDIDSVCR
jgi:hypothetical protein